MQFQPHNLHKLRQQALFLNIIVWLASLLNNKFVEEGPGLSGGSKGGGFISKLVEIGFNVFHKPHNGHEYWSIR